ncbi:MAG: hypothetical protein ABW321_30780 [Polyangiales bacterium]
MTAPEASTEPTLFDLRASTPAQLIPQPAAAATPAELDEPASDRAHNAQDAHDAQPVDAQDTPVVADAADGESGKSGPADRKRLAEQLDALKRKESELRRALVVADHPELGDAVRAIQGRAYAVTRAEEQLAQGLSKSEARRRETIDKKLTSLREKRAELDTQITALEQEQESLGTDRLSTFQSERRQALEQLLIALGLHEPALQAVGVESSSLIPELSRWLPEIETIARELTAAADARGV